VIFATTQIELMRSDNRRVDRMHMMGVFDADNRKRSTVTVRSNALIF